MGGGDGERERVRERGRRGGNERKPQPNYLSWLVMSVTGEEDHVMHDVTVVYQRLEGYSVVVFVYRNWNLTSSLTRHCPTYIKTQVISVVWLVSSTFDFSTPLPL